MAGDVVVCMMTRARSYSNGWLVAGVPEGRRGFLKWCMHLPRSVTEMEEHQSIEEAVASGVTKVTGILLVRSAREEGDFSLFMLMTSACVYNNSLIWNHRDQASGKLHRRGSAPYTVLSEG
jgi:hypothetical protein